MEKKYNTRSPAVKRLMREAAELSSPTSEFFAAPLDDNLFEWHFTVRGPSDTEFQGGVYHGRIIVPPEYPMKPPDIIVLTPNGRFEVGKKICLSISGHHPETWQPSWSIRTALLAIIGFMPTPSHGTIGSLDYSPEERRQLARRSVDWSCPLCGNIAALLLPAEQDGEMQTREEVKKVMETVQCKSEEELAQEKTFKATLDEKDAESGQADPQVDPASSSTSSQPEPSLAEPVRQQSTSPLPENNTLPEESSRGMQVYDILIMLLVAAIGAVLFRRINLMKESGGDHSLLDEE